MKTVEVQIPKKASAMQSICQRMEVWNTNFHHCSYAPDVWFWINLSLRAITRTHFERRHGKQSFIYLWLGYLKKLFVGAILDSYKYVGLRQKFVFFCLFLQPNCFCHWILSEVLQINCTVTLFWRHSKYIMTTFCIHSDYTLANLQAHAGCKTRSHITRTFG